MRGLYAFLPFPRVKKSPAFRPVIALVARLFLPHPLTLCLHWQAAHLQRHA